MTLYNIALFEMRLHNREMASIRYPPMIWRFSFVVESHTCFIKYYSLEPGNMWQHYAITLKI